MSNTAPASSLALLVVGILVGTFTLICASCGPSSQESTSGAKQMDPTEIQVDSNGYTVEQNNIIRRIKATGDPNKMMWLHLISGDGKIVARMVVQGKITSSGKRLQPTSQDSYGGGSTSGTYYPELLQPDGTYGSSDDYVFWFDPAGRYHQFTTGAGSVFYLLTDYPIVLGSTANAISSMYELDEVAQRWAAAQEAK